MELLLVATTMMLTLDPPLQKSGATPVPLDKHPQEGGLGTISLPGVM